MDFNPKEPTSDNTGMFSLVRQVALEAERLKYDSIWLMDHLIQISGVTSSPLDPMMECWTTLSAISAITSKIRIGTLVTCNGFRHPAVLAKMASTVDNLSGGRLEFGLGAGWNKAEHDAYGISFPNAAIRIQQLSESVQIIKKMWTEKSPRFKGKYYSVNGAVCMPKPIQKPHPPIWIGGSGNYVLSVIARHANGCNFWLPIDAYRSRLTVLEEHCTKYGRPAKSIIRSLSTRIAIGHTEEEANSRLDKFKSLDRQGLKHFLSQNINMAIRRPGRALSFLRGRVLGLGSSSHSTINGTPKDCVEALRKYLDLGVTHFMVQFPGSSDFESMRLFAEEVIPVMRESSSPSWRDDNAGP